MNDNRLSRKAASHKATSRKEDILKEIDLIPNDRLEELYDLVHSFRKRAGDAVFEQKNVEKIMQLAGSWDDWSEAEFDAFVDEIQQRRRDAFLGRRGSGTRID